MLCTEEISPPLSLRRRREAVQSMGATQINDAIERNTGQTGERALNAARKQASLKDLQP